MQEFRNLLHKITPVHIFVFFIVLHVGLININAAEWGDSYRILRASEYLRYDRVYPEDEKRPPLYSLVLAARPENVDQVLWGRIVMFGVSTLSFLVFHQLLKIYFPNDRKKHVLGLLLFTLNPVFLYWALRIMADVFFTLLVLAAVYCFEWHKSRMLTYRVILLGVCAGLAILTRFEGYILFGALGLGLWFSDGFGIRNTLVLLKKNFLRLVIFTVTTFLVLLPYLMYRNPLNSSYFEEPGGRAYDLNIIVIYVLSLLFLFGVIPAFYFLYENRRWIREFLSTHVVVASFLIIELLLILAWPAAIPRIFVPVIPFMIILLTDSVIKFFNQPVREKPDFIMLVITGGLLALYVVGQYIYKLQFLVLIKPLFALIIILALVQMYLMYRKHLLLFVLASFISMLIWSLATIYIHKDIFRVIQEANIYVLENLQGNIGHNDISSVSDWYLNDKRLVDNISGVYFDITKNGAWLYENIEATEVDYFMVTNEHDTGLDFDIEDGEHLTLVKEFSSIVNGKEFWTRIIKFNK